jgi:hypothetical protein
MGRAKEEPFLHNTREIYAINTAVEVGLFNFRWFCSSVLLLVREHTYGMAHTVAGASISSLPSPAQFALALLVLKSKPVGSSLEGVSVSKSWAIIS